jgi:DNA-binding FrmR family transcriptional regulator
MKAHPCHNKSLTALKRIEGQVRGIQKMIDDGRYCVDILTQLQAVNNAVGRVKDDVLERHVNGCVKTAIADKSEKKRTDKVNEVIKLLKTFRKVG